MLFWLCAIVTNDITNMNNEANHGFLFKQNLVWIKKQSCLISTLFYIEKIFLIFKNQVLSEKMKTFRIFCRFFQIPSKVQWFCKFQWLNRKNYIKLYPNICSFFFIKKRFEVDIKIDFLVKNRELQVTITCLITITGS